jgi:amino acid transporter
MKHTRIPGWLAVVININIVLASAFCIDLKKIWASSGGVPAFFIWPLCALAILPLVMVLARLASRFPFSGGLYIYSKRALGPLCGFVSGWGYFIGAIASNAYIIHLFSLHLHRIPIIDAALGRIGLSDVWIELAAVALFALLNLVSMYVVFAFNLFFVLGKAIILFTTLMIIPKLFDLHQWSALHVDWQGLIIFLPFVLFSYIGIEACCSVADKIIDGSHDIARVIMATFVAITLFYLLFQFVFFCLHGTQTSDPFFHLMPLLTDNPKLVMVGDALMMGAVLSSFLAGYYGMFYYNSWNLHAIARDRGIIGARFLSKLNRYEAPWACILVQALLVIPFVVLTRSRFCLMTVGVMATVMVYFLSIVSFLILFRSALGYVALASCIGMMLICGIDLWRPGALVPMIILVVLLIVGIGTHFMARMRGKG